MRECGGGNARLLETGYGIDGFGPGRWLVSLRDRQIVKSTAIADWQQKAGSWSAQRGGGVEWTGVGREGVGVGGQNKSVARVASPIFSHRRSKALVSRVLHHWMRLRIFGSTRTLFSASNWPCGNIARALFVDIPHLFVHFFLAQQKPL
jgi:hypothetical protein